MIKTWTIPTWCGDYRLEASDDGNKSVLVVTDPTPAELKQLGAFLKSARSEGWVGAAAGVSDRGESRVDINASIAVCGPKLLGDGLRVNKGILTVIVSKDGNVTAVDGTGASAIESVSVADADEAVSTKRPTPCCPRPYVGTPEDRASRTLLRFSTRRQQVDWQESGYMYCRGNLSGRLYRIAHRHSELARRQGRVLYDVVGGYEVHCHASQYPPSEEALAIKHAVEHREDWIRNPSTMFHVASRGHGGRPVYRNPFRTGQDQLSDGLQDASITSFLGGMLRGFEVFSAAKKKS